MDDQRVSRVEFYLNDDLLGEDTEAPYELTFNSKKYEDGKYTLKTVAYDGANNQSSAIREIEIFNTLLKARVGGNYVSEITERWLVITNTKGKVIDYEMMENNKDIHFVRPDTMKEEKINMMLININLFTRYHGDRVENITIAEYHGIIPSVLTFEENELVNERDSLGEITINYIYGQEKKRFTSNHNISRTKWSNYHVNDSIHETGSYLIFAKPASVYFGFFNMNDENDIPAFIFLNELSSGKEYSFSEKDYSFMKLNQHTSLPDNQYCNLILYGISEEGYEYKLCEKNYPYGITDFKTYFPEHGFEDYRYSLYFSSDQFSYYISDKGKPLNSYTIPEFNMKIDEDNPELFSATISIDRETDFLTNLWQYSEYNETENSTINIQRYISTDIEEGKLEVNPMRIPIEILESYTSLQNHIDDLSYSYSGVANYEGSSSLSDYVNLIFNPDYKTAYFESITIHPINSNAKLSREQFPKHLQEEKMRRGETW